MLKINEFLQYLQELKIFLRILLIKSLQFEKNCDNISHVSDMMRV